MKVHCLYDELVTRQLLKPHPKNRNQHSVEQIARLAQILKYQGWRYPVKVSKRSGYVTSGHGRMEAAWLNGWNTVPVNYQDYESEEQEYADVIADNAIASWAELDLAGVNHDFIELGPDFDIDLLGIQDFVLEPADKEGLTDEDEVPEVSKSEARTKSGELYQLGEHRLLCGDSTDSASVARLMNGEKADMVLITDPPYGVNLGSHKAANEKRDGLQSRKGYASVSDSKDTFSSNVVPGIKNILEKSVRGAVFGFTPNIWEFPAPAVIGGIFVPAGTGRNKWGWTTFMPILLYGIAPNLEKGAKPIVLNSNASGEKVDHPASKPVEWMSWLIELSVKNSEIVIDPFLGSGSTLIACEKTNRKCYGMEIDPHYCDVIIERWQKYTGKIAMREDGVSWADIKQSMLK